MAAAESVAATAAATASTNAKLALKDLFKWKESQSATGKPQLLPQDDFIYLNLTLKKIPQKPRTKPFQIPLPHPLYNPFSSELCLIIDDRPSSNLTKQTAQKIIKSQNIVISKVLKLSKLKTNYKPFEAKRKLCDSYDLFLVDRRIVHLLPKLLGSSFFKKKKLPLSLDLSHKNWSEQIERATGCGLMYVRTGTCCVMKVAKVSMEFEEIIENVVAAIKGMVDLVPKKWLGVRSLQLKFSDSLALPVYQALPDMKFRIECAKESVGLSNLEVEVKDGSQVEEKKEKKEKKKKKKGRIHEVRYMDVDAGEPELESKGEKSEDDELLGGNEDGNDENEGNENENDNDLDNAESAWGKGKKVNLEANVSVNGNMKKKMVKREEREGKKKKLSSETAEESIDKKETRKNKAGKRLKEASKEKKAKNGKTRL